MRERERESSWRGGKSKRIKNGGMIEKWEDRKYFNFSPFCLIGSEKVKGWKK